MNRNFFNPTNIRNFFIIAATASLSACAASQATLKDGTIVTTVSGDPFAPALTAINAPEEFSHQSITATFDTVRREVPVTTMETRTVHTAPVGCSAQCATPGQTRTVKVPVTKLETVVDPDTQEADIGFGLKVVIPKQPAQTTVISEMNKGMRTSVVGGPPPLQTVAAPLVGAGVLASGAGQVLTGIGVLNGQLKPAGDTLTVTGGTATGGNAQGGAGGNAAANAQQQQKALGGAGGQAQAVAAAPGGAATGNGNPTGGCNTDTIGIGGRGNASGSSPVNAGCGNPAGVNGGNYSAVRTLGFGS